MRSYSPLRACRARRRSLRVNTRNLQIEQMFFAQLQNRTLLPSAGTSGSGQERTRTPQHEQKRKTASGRAPRNPMLALIVRLRR
jgi:hypothetical protein